jgi:hypothetical protein
MSGMPWFRLYSEFIGDPVIQCLSFEDQRHYVGILCLKCSGLLDKLLEKSTRERMIARGLGLDPASAEEAKRRLCDASLIDAKWQPIAWDKRQYSGAKLPDGESLNGARGYVYFIGPEKGDVKIGYSKNPWARVKDIQTATTKQLRVLATARTTEYSEASIHALFSAHRKAGEWFVRCQEINSVINALSTKEIITQQELVSYVEKLRSSDVSTTTDTEQSQNRTEFISTANAVEGKSRGLPPCPYEQIVDLYHKTLPTLRRIVRLTPARKAQIKARWNEDNQDLDGWRIIFEHIGESDFLMGRTKPRTDNQSPFQADLDWITKAANWVKIIEGKYHG